VISNEPTCPTTMRSNPANLKASDDFVIGDSRPSEFGDFSNAAAGLPRRCPATPFWLKIKSRRPDTTAIALESCQKLAQGNLLGSSSNSQVATISLTPSCGSRRE
jgi:hypothetical protein